MEAEVQTQAQVEVRNTPQALSPCEALIGMLLMLDQDMVFSQDSLRKFLREQNRWQPCFENLFHTRLSPRNAQANEDGLSVFLGMILADEGQNFKIRPCLREVALEQLEKHGSLPSHEEQLKAEAERFTAFVRQGQQ